jgi:hypothetical protein
LTLHNHHEAAYKTTKTNDSTNNNDNSRNVEKIAIQMALSRILDQEANKQESSKRKQQAVQTQSSSNFT